MTVEKTRRTEEINLQSILHKMSHSTSIVPIVLWGKTPPSHLISVVTCTYDQKTVITGTSDGQIGLWDLRHTKDAGLQVWGCRQSNFSTENTETTFFKFANHSPRLKNLACAHSRLPEIQGGIHVCYAGDLRRGLVL